MLLTLILSKHFRTFEIRLKIFKNYPEKWEDKMLRMLLILGILVSCGTERRNERSQVNPEIQRLKNQVFELQGSVAQIDAFTASDFSNCTTGLPAFETKICQIAQTATAEQRVLFSSQLAETTKIFQNELYGEDCINTTEPGCPVVGSILSDIQQVSTNTSNIQENADDIIQLQSDMLILQSDISTLEGRLDNFNGTGSSIEVVIDTIQSDLNTLSGRVDVLEDSINSDRVYQSVPICGDIVDSGPLYEVILLSGDKTTITGYIQAGGRSGLGLIKETNDGQGDIYARTTLNTRRCGFNIYDLTTELKICWANHDRRSSSSDIDMECDEANGFANPTANCTCY
jgi:hypothetical protein